MMESAAEQQRHNDNETHRSDAAAADSASHGLMSIRTLQTWQIPDQCMASISSCKDYHIGTAQCTTSAE